MESVNEVDVTEGDVMRDNSIVAEGGEPCVGVEQFDLSLFRTISHPLERRGCGEQE
jgi:hypothetical protein